MPIEIKGQQLRVRIASPKRGKKFGTQVLSPRLSRVSMRTDHHWETQAWRINLSRFPTLGAAFREIDELLISAAKKREAKVLVRRWWKQR